MEVEKDEFLIDGRKFCNDDDETTASGRPFQPWAVATGKARLPTGDSLMGGATRRRWYLLTAKLADNSSRTTISPTTLVVQVQRSIKTCPGGYWTTRVLAL